MVQSSYDPIPIDDEDAERFIDAWASFLAEASAGRLQHLRINREITAAGRMFFGQRSFALRAPLLGLKAPEATS